ncbi:hypothetical protein Y1Q_0021248 [Alligator mississippiensis]|uniref:Uncharacterized protein n=1 Tax=Alligator mississippiensis TaxID=8496 RepID=A0A151MS39_ALLMI|nr:hypothetical protein Y1Q_0021248 [Alligator mississippiensis]
MGGWVLNGDALAARASLWLAHEGRQRASSRELDPGSTADPGFQKESCGTSDLYCWGGCTLAPLLPYHTRVDKLFCRSSSGRKSFKQFASSSLGARGGRGRGARHQALDPVLRRHRPRHGDLCLCGLKAGLL